MSDQGRLIHEMLHLQRSPDLKRVDHKQGEHNDLGVGLVGVNYLIQNSIIKEGMGQVGQKNSSFGKLVKFRRW